MIYTQSLTVALSDIVKYHGLDLALNKLLVDRLSLNRKPWIVVIKVLVQFNMLWFVLNLLPRLLLHDIEFRGGYRIDQLAILERIQVVNTLFLQLLFPKGPYFTGLTRWDVMGILSRLLYRIKQRRASRIDSG